MLVHRGTRGAVKELGIRAGSATGVCRREGEVVAEAENAEVCGRVAESRVHEIVRLCSNQSKEGHELYFESDLV